MRFQELGDFMSSGDEDLSHDMLEEHEDLLHQLSAELGIPDFLDEGFPSHQADTSTASPPSPAPQELTHLGGLESGLLSDHMMDMTDSLFPEMPSSSDSAYSGSIKSEPSSPWGMLPPSPTSSEGSEGRLSCHSPPPAPLPTLSLPPEPSPSPAPTLLLSTDGSVQLLPPASPSPSLLSLQGLPPGLQGKIAIPKIRKPVPQPTQPLVLQLSSDGLYYTKTGVCSTTAATPLIVKTEPCSVTSSFCSPLITGLPTVTTAAAVEEGRNMKRQQRMIKNRESACISRKRKKEYVTNLEDHINSLNTENTQLRNENENLKEKVRELEAEKKLWTSSVLSSTNGKKATAVFALLFMVSLNVSSLSTIGARDAITLETRGHVKDGGRVLMSVLEQEEEVVLEEQVYGADLEQEARANLTRARPPPMCRMFQNQTESIRLESELRGWFSLEPESPRRRPDSTSRPTPAPAGARRRGGKGPVKEQGALGQVISSPLHSLTGSVYHMLIQDSLQESGSAGALGMYDSPHMKNTFASFFDAIDRRDDTFYVVSFSGDHLLVPATNHSQANRPRMSLLLPAMQVSLNESHRGPPGSIAMMKIDCEVMNTQLLHVHPDAVPLHMAANLRASNLSSGEKEAPGEFQEAGGPRQGNYRRKQEFQEFQGESGGAGGNSLFTRNYRNSARSEMEQQEADNVTLDSDSLEKDLLGDVPLLAREYQTAQRMKSARRKRRAGGAQ